MFSSKQLLSGLLLAGLIAGCAPPAVEPELTLTASPRSLDGLAQKSTLRVIAVDAKGKSGTGKVRLTSVAGSLKAGVEVDLAAGEGTTDFTCTFATDSACTSTVKITAEWVVSGKLVSATTSVTITPVVIDAGFDAGVIDAGVIDAGPPVDGGYLVTLTADKNQIIAGVGDVAIFTASVVSTSPVASLPLSFTTTLGRLGPVGASSVGTVFQTTTNDAGVAQAQLVAGSMDMGQATVSARIDGGVSMPLIVSVVNVSGISYVSTECPQTIMNCNLMGLQGSGFNETSLVKFRVIDGAGGGVGGVTVLFSLVNAPAGTTVDPMGVTNGMGEVRANVRAGTTVGTFTVTATALSMFTNTSPTIGVRGAKASNRGFTLRCDRVNLPAFANNVASAPLPLTVNCQVGLTDRYANPVGTGTQVRLNSEAGTVPNNVTTNAFTPAGTSEGFGSFVFNTLGFFPPIDLAPFPADLAQYPFPRLAEPSVAGAVTRNPRDGLVTIIAYLQGEEDFKDDNQNGIRDGTEQIIDQGEPFVDANDNNIRDTGEAFIDTPPADGGVANGIWDGPNGIWDSNATIWTEFRLIYSGWASPSLSMLTLAPTRTAGGNFGTLFLSSTKTLAVYAPDSNLNRVEGGSTISSRLAPPTRGSSAIARSNIALDGYGFDLRRILVNVAGTAACATGELVCRWRVLVGGWTEGYIADLELTGAQPPTMPLVESAIADVVVRGVTTSPSASGTVE